MIFYFGLLRLEEYISEIQDQQILIGFSFENSFHCGNRRTMQKFNDFELFFISICDRKVGFAIKFITVLGELWMGLFFDTTLINDKLLFYSAFTNFTSL